MLPLKNFFVALACVASTTLTLNAQIRTPAPSPSAKLEQVVGVTKFKVDYSRPSMRDRKVYGGLVPYGEVWRTGANATTKVSFDSEISFGGKTVPAGDYVLFSIPGADEWTVILYGDTTVSNAGAYDEKKDVARVQVKPVKLAAPVESFMIGFDNLRDESATMFLDWSDVRVAVPLTIDTKSLSAASIEEALKNMDAWKAGDYANAAAFYHSTGKDRKKALEWMEKATEMNKNAFWWQYAYAEMLAEQGDKDAARAASEKSLATAKATAGGDSGYVKRNEEFLAKLK
jgi:hypothetical protein